MRRKSLGSRVRMQGKGRLSINSKSSVNKRIQNINLCKNNLNKNKRRINQRRKKRQVSRLNWMLLIKRRVNLRRKMVSLIPALVYSERKSRKSKKSLIGLRPKS